MDNLTEQTGLRILHLEDNPFDAEIVEHKLRESGLSFIIRRVDTRDAFISALEEFKPDIVLADYRLPAFDGISALKIIRQEYSHIPVVMVTGAAGDERAVEFLKLGARDYILKDRLGRLDAAVLDAIREEQDTRKHKLAEARVRKLARLYATLNHTNQAIVRANNREELFVRICESSVIHGDFIMAWVGLVDEAAHRVKPAYYFGAGKDYLAGISISMDDITAGRGVTGVAIRNNRVCHMNDFATDERVLPWREKLLKAGFRGGAGLPLRIGGKTIGALTLYTDEPDFFDADQVSLLEELADDIGFALDNLEREAERSAMEKRLVKSEQHFRAVTESATDAIITATSDGNITGWNAAAERMFGYAETEIIGKPLTMLVPERFREQHRAGLARVASGGAPYAIGKAMELAGLCKGGREFSLELTLAQWKTEEGMFFTAIIRDITERSQYLELQAQEHQRTLVVNAQLAEANQQLKQAQSQLLQSEKMAAIGLLAAGVAHEINNPIGYVNSNLGTLEKYSSNLLAILDKYEAAEVALGAGNPVLEELRQLKNRCFLDRIRKDIGLLLAESRTGLERVKKIVLDLKSFSRTDSDEQWLLADVHEVLESALNVVWNELKYKCEVIKEYSILPKTNCLPLQLGQVFMNLLVNAAQAIEKRGKIILRTGQEANMVWVEVSDTGAGISPENMHHMFEPFFTTKPIGKGTGLGLSVSYRIVEKHHGRIEVQSELGKGAAFRVWLPIEQPST